MAARDPDAPEILLALGVGHYDLTCTSLRYLQYSRPRGAGSEPRDDDLQVFAGHDHGLVPRPVEALNERPEVALQRGLPLWREGGERLHRPVVGLEHRKPVLGRAVAEDEVLVG